MTHAQIRQQVLMCMKWEAMLPDWDFVNMNSAMQDMSGSLGC